MDFEKKSVETIKSELLEKLRTAFGSGLTWGAALLQF